MVAVTLVLGAGDFALTLGGFTIGGIGTATFGAILLNALLSRGKWMKRKRKPSPPQPEISAALLPGGATLTRPTMGM
jgi:putative pyrimidine permease RutG